MQGRDRLGLSAITRSCRRRRRTRRSMTCCTPTPASSGRRVVEGLVEPKLAAKDVPEHRRRLPLCGERQDLRRLGLHQRDRLRLPHRQGAGRAEILEGSRRPEARRRARQLHHPGQQPRPDAPDDARQDLRQGADRSRRRLQGAGAAEADQDVRLHRRHGEGAALGRGEHRRAARQRHLSLRRAEPAGRRSRRRPRACCRSSRC